MLFVPEGCLLPISDPRLAGFKCRPLLRSPDLYYVGSRCLEIPCRLPGFVGSRSALAVPDSHAVPNLLTIGTFTVFRLKLSELRAERENA